jgi:RNA polymerase sigma factor (sigma-70 family)
MTAIPEFPRTPAQPIYPSASKALEANLHILGRAASRFPMTRADREDVYQEAAVAFLTHYPEFDPTRGVPLEAFMWPWVLGAVRHFVRDLAVARDHLTYPDDPADLDRPDSISAYDAVLDLDVERYLRALAPDDRALIVRLYWHDKMPVEIARSQGVTRQTIHARQRRLLALGHTSITATVAAA